MKDVKSAERYTCVRLTKSDWDYIKVTPHQCFDANPNQTPIAIIFQHQNQHQSKDSHFPLYHMICLSVVLHRIDLMSAVRTLTKYAHIILITS